MSPHRLTKLQIDSVDSVDRGAGKGVRVLLMKSDNERDEPMSLDFNDPKQLVDAITKQLMKSGLSHDQSVTEILKAARPKPKAVLAKPEPPDDTEPDADADDVNKAIDAMVSKGMSRDQAATAIIRKARGW